jgi:Arc/MetJ-type ribon-helix-helix transcriptional regulator
MTPLSWRWQVTRARRSGKITGMTGYQKIAVSLPWRAAESARRAVRRGRAPSVSAYVAAAIEDKAKLDDLATLLDEMLAASGGPLTAAERRAADRALTDSKVKSGRKAR